MIIFGILHFKYTQPLLDLVPRYLPGGQALWVSLDGVALILAGISILMHKLTRISCLLLASMFGLFIFMVRLPHLSKMENAPRQNLLIEISKEFALAGSALVIAGSKKKNGAETPD